ncbi:hypothetical protein [Vreelandella glaciei]|uniref:hypothetical protein n=1 Tax=Vreelandella glaciei TaxID=186761 RepID=UPI0030033496
MAGTPLSGRRKALSCDTVPHFTTLASFVSRHAVEIEALFEQVLRVCHEQGLLGNELFAIDGCKMSSDASKEWSGTFKDKKHQIIIDAQAFGEDQEHHTLKPVLEKVEVRFKKLGIAESIYRKCPS